MENYAERIQLLSDAMEDMISRMKAVDDRCVEIHKNISVRELHLICFVGKNEKVIMSDISEYMDVPMSTATGIVDKLVQKNYLKRSHSEFDRRTVQIELNSDGITACHQLMDMKHSMSGLILDMLTDEETNVLIKIIDKISAGMQEVAAAK